MPQLTNPERTSFSRRKFALLAGISTLIGGSLRLPAQNKPGFPDGFDAVEAAPESHKVLFENVSVRVLQVQVAPGVKEPMHHHRWPSIFLNWDAGGRTEHQRIYHADGSVHDIPSQERPLAPGSWRVKWLEPEPMHSVENLETPESAKLLPQRPPTVRVEFKFLG
jgi:hypothetical protein